MAACLPPLQRAKQFTYGRVLVASLLGVFDAALDEEKQTFDGDKNESTILR
jgi:hypothetical protein